MEFGEETRFDREVRLTELFGERELARLRASFSRLLDCPVEIVGPKADARPGWRRAAINWDLEPIGYLEVEEISDERLAGALDLFTVLVKGAMRYRMASDLHLETVRADFEALQQKHAQLQRSEQQYRQLSEQLEQKVAEQVKTIRAAQTKIYQSEKLASVGQLAAGVAHELNTPLTYILNNLVSAKDYLRDINSFLEVFREGGERDRLQEAWREADIDYVLDDFPVLLAESQEGVRRAATIISHLKDFSNINRQDQQLTDINAQLETVLKMLDPQVREGVEITLEKGALPQTLCYPAHLGQVFYNLILNGVQAIEGEGKVQVITAAANNIIEVSVRDTGIGIEEAHLTRIFDPFFTTKDVGSGTGLGLSVIHEVLKAHGGRVEVHSKPGAGSTFTVFLPVASRLPDSNSPDEKGLGRSVT